LSHVVNLGAQEVLKNFSQPVDVEYYDANCDSNDQMVTAVSRLCFLCRKIRKSPKMRRLLQKICQEQNCKYLVPIIDVKTRWNSTYDMLVRALDMKELLCETIFRTQDSSLIRLILQQNDWNCIKNLIDILLPFKELTLFASQRGENFCITRVLPLYHYCTAMLEKQLKSGVFTEEDDIYVGMESALEKLQHYYDKISPIAGVALILDPNRKRNYLRKKLAWKEEWIAHTSMYRLRRVIPWISGRRTSLTILFYLEWPKII
jgi:hypothetical protein